MTTKRHDARLLGLVGGLLIAVLLGAACAGQEARADSVSPGNGDPASPGEDAPAVGQDSLLAAQPPTPVPRTAGRTLDYVYNPVEFYIARAPEHRLRIIHPQLVRAGYEISEADLRAFHRDFEIREGDSVLVRGEVAQLNETRRLVTIGSPIAAVGPLLCRYEEASPPWVQELAQSTAAGEPPVVTVRGTVEATQLRGCSPG